MSKIKSKYRAIDLYSGIGGWSLGLSMAGIDVVASYEWWDKANRTNKANNKHLAEEVDIRQLNLNELPENINIVVGSPPCTQFSYANRGGSGDIEDGLKDIAQFLSVVDRIKPKFWAMENVPRVAKIIVAEMMPGGCLEQFSDLQPHLQIVDTCHWGVPQRRKRCIVGNIDFDLLNQYAAHTEKRTLGDVVNALSRDVVTDPIYGIALSRTDLVDHEIEEFLSQEEERINKEMKIFHPVYNNMAFPDPLDRAARTVTATCTRVSRESIVIAAPEKKEFFRRLTVRERSCLQGFPITYQFYGDSYSQKLKMIGNAVPPLFTFYVAQTMLGVKPTALLSPSTGIHAFTPSLEKPKVTTPDKISGKFPKTRRFRAVIPNLRFKSGVRFEFANSFRDSIPEWGVYFFFGNSKNIGEIILDEELIKELKAKSGLEKLIPTLKTLTKDAIDKLRGTDAITLQLAWTHDELAGTHPFEIVDVIGVATQKVLEEFSDKSELARDAITEVMAFRGNAIGTLKVVRHAHAIFAGLLVGSYLNIYLKSRRFNKRG
jgi:DNA (cytosine-5)-methyltransferase 1